MTINKDVKEIGAAILITTAISYGLTDYFFFWKTFVLLLSVSAAYFVFWKVEPPVVEDDTEELDKVFNEFTSVIDEQGEVIKEYEKIFDSQLVSLPCICGGNTFQGLFSPNTENIVECEKCQGVYKVEVSYNSVLMSEPLDINDNSLYDKMANVKNPEITN